MRITINIPAATYQRLKSESARQGCSIQKLILSTMEQKLPSRPRKKGWIELPIFHSMQPGTLRLTNEDIYSIIPFP
jgi:hypothetical protein